MNFDYFGDKNLDFAIFESHLETGKSTKTVVLKKQIKLDIEPTQIDHIGLTSDKLSEGAGTFFAPIYPSDFIAYKPTTDICLLGSCHTPEGRLLTQCPIAIRIGGWSRQLQVFGDRYWVSTAGVASHTEPQPFTRMSIGPENCFGGEGISDNPGGKGANKITRDGRTFWPLPNVEEPGSAITSPRDRPFPALPCALPLMGDYRRSKLGTLDKHWLKTRWPAYPDDMDWSMFNAAHPLSQYPGYLQGNETLELFNLVEGQPHYSFQLPSERPRVFVNSSDKGFYEVPVALDTLWIDTDSMELVLVWRGWTAVSEPDMPEVREILVSSETLGANQSTDVFYQQLIDHRMEEYGYNKDPFAPENDEPVDDENTDADKKEASAEHEEALDSADPEFADSPEDEPPAMPDIDPAVDAAFAAQNNGKTLTTTLQEILAATDEPDDEDAEPDTAEDIDPRLLARQNIEERIQNKQSLAEHDFTGIDVGGLQFTNCDLRDTTFSGHDLSGVSFDNADLTGASFEGCTLTEARFAGACLREANFTDCIAPSADFSHALMEDAALSQCKLEDCTFASVRADRIDFSDAVLRGANFSEASLPRADFSGSELNHANFIGAMLDNADFSDAIAIYGKFINADLTQLRAAGSGDFSGAKFHDAILFEANFEGVRLLHADFRNATMVFCNLEKADASHAKFDGAVLRGARFPKATLFETSFRFCDLFEVTFECALFTRTDLTGANAYSAEFLEAKFEQTIFQGCNLHMTKLAKELPA